MSIRPGWIQHFLAPFPKSPVKILSILSMPLGGRLLAADPPALIPSQGDLARPTAASANKFETMPSGQYDILFTLHTEPAGGESKVWGPERHTRVVVVNGVVNPMLGSVIGFADAIAVNPSFLGLPLYVGIATEADENPMTADFDKGSTDLPSNPSSL